MENFQADLLIEDRKIVQAKTGISVPGGCEIVDASGLDIYPGFVEAHCHIGLDGTNPFDPALKTAALSGITCIGTGPGSSNAIGGAFIAMKTVGKRVDDMIVKAPAAMKSP